MKKVFIFVTVLSITIMLLAGCTASESARTPDETAPIITAPASGQETPDSTPAPGPTTQPPSSGPSTGTLTVFVTDAPSYQVNSVTVHFSSVEVHVAADEEGGQGGWIPLKLDVDGGTFGDTKEIEINKDMGNVTLAAGQLDIPEGGTIKITQIRVYMDEEGVTVNYTPDPEDVDENTNEPNKETVSAKLPSGKLRFVRPFVMVAGEGATIGLDFQLQDSVVWPGAFGKGSSEEKNQDKLPIFKPVVKLEITPQGDQENQDTLLLENKDPNTWEVIADETKGTLTYNLSGETFDFEFEGEGLEDTNYSLIYYADYYGGDPEDRYTVWGGNYPGALIASGDATGGTLKLSGSVNLRPDLTEEKGIDLPWPTDGNIKDYAYNVAPDNYVHAHGAKIWLVPSECYEAGTPEEPVCQVTKWEPDRFLFETDLITFNDTNNVSEPLQYPEMLNKTGSFNDENQDGYAQVGETINYDFTVTNTGNVTLTNVTVTDPNVTVSGGPIASLAPGASDSTTFTASYTITQADIDAGSVDNTATATGTPPVGDDVSDDDDESVNLPQSPGIELIKTGTWNDDGDCIPEVGETISYTFKVTNTGNVTLTNVTVTDPNVTVSGGPIASLAPGASDSTTFTASYTITQADIDAGSVDNTATATGTPPVGDDVSDDDDETVNLL
ncbi:DUF4382 domain-containing protein [Chloroflexota bacterium]